MKTYYSAQTRSFHDESASLPADAKLVAPETIAILFSGQEAGKRIVPGPDGLPILDEQKPQPALTLEETFELRRAVYARESDPMKIEAEHDAILAGADPDYTAWLAKVAEIKARYPLPAPD